MYPQELRIADYEYELPDDRIAKYPLADRDASKLLIYQEGAITEDVYRNIAIHIPANTAMVFNQTKVVHARLLFRKSTGGMIEIFCLSPHEQYADIHTAMLQKGKVLWECMIGGASKWKHGSVLQLACDHPRFILSAEIKERRPGGYVVNLEWNDPDLTFAEVLHFTGKVPLPPYLHRDAEPADDTRYQTVFAKEEGSVAAPTAGLHFTNEILASLAAKNIDRVFVTLHVGAGTFKPVKSETMLGHEMHAEWIDVGYDTIQQLAGSPGKKIVAVGTTSLRTLESLYWIGCKLAQQVAVDLHSISVRQWDPYEKDTRVSKEEALAAIAGYMKERELDRLVTRTQILIAPGYRFRIVDGLVTNFHQPESTLLLLVAALIGPDWKKVYDFALENNYRFLSYGDGSLLWRSK